MGHPSMPRWRYTVTDPVPTHYLLVRCKDTNIFSNPSNLNKIFPFLKKINR